MCARSTCGSMTGENLDLDQLASSSKSRAVRSQVLGEEILIVGNFWVRPKKEGRVAYTVKESRLLIGKDPEKMRSIHAVKVAFDGIVTDVA